MHFGVLFGGADSSDFRLHRAAADGADGGESRGDSSSCRVQSLFSSGVPPGFSMYEGGDGGRGSVAVERVLGKLDPHLQRATV